MGGDFLPLGSRITLRLIRQPACARVLPTPVPPPQGGRPRGRRRLPARNASDLNAGTCGRNARCQEPTRAFQMYVDTDTLIPFYEPLQPASPKGWFDEGGKSAYFVSQGSE